MILISACLCGVNCKYNGKNNLNEQVLKLFKEGKAVLVCPEQLGGKKTPRSPHEIIDGTGSEVLDGKSSIKSSIGEDSTEEFLKGAYETLKMAENCNAKIAILKSNSPSCGYGQIYDGNFSGQKIDGNGITAELLLRNGIKIYTEKDIEFIKNL